MEEHKALHRNLAVVASIMGDIQTEFSDLKKYTVAENEEAHKAISHGERLLKSIAQAMENVDAARADGVDVTNAEAHVLQWRARLGVFVHDCMYALQNYKSEYKERRARLRAQFLQDLRAVATGGTTFSPYGWYVLGVALLGTFNEYKEYDAATEALRHAEESGDEKYAVLATRKLQEIAQKRSEGENKKGGCFVATAAFGSPLADEVFLLRRLRDEILAVSSPGRSVVRVYYRFSPAAAAWLMRGERRRLVARKALQPVVYLCRRGFRS